MINNAAADGASERTRQILVSFYDLLKAGDFERFPTAYYSPDIVVEIPPYMPHGGVHRGLDELLTNLAKGAGLVNFHTIRVEELVADGEDAVAVIRINIADSEEEIVMAEHWKVQGEKLAYMRLYLFDPSPALARMKRMTTTES